MCTGVCLEFVLDLSGKKKNQTRLHLIKKRKQKRRSDVYATMRCRHMWRWLLKMLKPQTELSVNCSRGQVNSVCSQVKCYEKRHQVNRPGNMCCRIVILKSTAYCAGHNSPVSRQAGIFHWLFYLFIYV